MRECCWARWRRSISSASTWPSTSSTGRGRPWSPRTAWCAGSWARCARRATWDGRARAGSSCTGIAAGERTRACSPCSQRRTSHRRPLRGTTSPSASGCGSSTSTSGVSPRGSASARRSTPSCVRSSARTRARSRRSGRSTRPCWSPGWRRWRRASATATNPRAPCWSACARPMSDTRKLVETVVEGSTAVVRLDNPPVNALTPALFAELAETRSIVAASAVRVVIVTGVRRVFSVGGDLSAIAKFPSAGEAESQASTGRALLDDLFGMPKPFIAAVNGLCLGGGLEIALACHLRVCGTRARFGFPELSLGFIPGLGGVGRLARLVGRAKALEMVLSGQTVKAPEAHRIGLVNRCVAPGRVLAEAQKLARAIARAEPAAALAALELVDEVDAEREAELFGSLVARPVAKKNLLDLVE